MSATTSTQRMAAIAAIAAARATGRRSAGSASCGGCCGVDGGTPTPLCGQLGPPWPSAREGRHAGPPSALVLDGGGGIRDGGVEAVDPMPGAGPGGVAPGAVVVPVAWIG